jgi:toxin ParE1/3/4
LLASRTVTYCTENEWTPTWRVAKFPLLWCYFERGDHLDVVRLLGERQDLAAILGDEFASN